MILDNVISHIKVGWKDYKVELVDKVMVEEKECYGSCKFDDETILLRKINEPKQMKATLIHEVLHAIDEMYSFNMDEVVIAPLADALFTTLEDNNLEIACKNIVRECILEEKPFPCKNGFVRVGVCIQSSVSNYDARGEIVELVRSSVGKHLVRLRNQSHYYPLEDFYIVK
jgi:hypothetical protein